MIGQLGTLLTLVLLLRVRCCEGFFTHFIDKKVIVFVFVKRNAGGGPKKVAPYEDRVFRL